MFGWDTTKLNGGLDGSSLLQDVDSDGSSSRRSCASLPSSITALGLSKVSMNNTLTKFLSVASQGLSTWMMQSMLSSTSNAICQQYIDERMKAQILKLKEANVCLSRKAAARKAKIPPKSINCDHSLSVEEQDPLPFIQFLQPCVATDIQDEQEALEDVTEEKEELQSYIRLEQY
ncbi:hypothetical protein ACA910_003561 [Epithemia clementina (nom. ined.)]